MSGLNILVVEDNPGDLYLIKDMLHSSALPLQSVNEAASLADGLAILSCRSIDIVLLDLTLPATDGIASYQAIQNVQANVPVIIITGIVYAPTILSLIRNGIQDYLVKGEFSLQQIEESVLRGIWHNKKPAMNLKW